MDGDVHLHCKRGVFGGRRIVICEPGSLRRTSPGPFNEPPLEWKSSDRLIANVDVLDEWARDAVGDDILRAVNQYALQNRGLSRLLISSDDKLRAEALAAPWELLEHTPTRFRSAQLAVVRLLEADVPVTRPDSVPRLRLLTLYADPAGNITQMESHIEALRNFAKENDEKVEAKILCFEDAQVVLKQCLGFDPHIVYFIGHGSQDGNEQVHFQIGARDKPGTIDISRFADLLKRTGSPRLVIVNACESFAGSNLDPYLGASLRLSPQFDFVVAMQMEEPIPAATDFAVTLLNEIAQGGGLASAMIAARTAMAERAEPDFAVTPYIPVLIQRTRQDVPFSVDVDEQDLTRLRKLMAFRLEHINRFARKAEASIRGVLKGEGSACHISILTGPSDCGKSTTVRGVLAGLLTTEQVKLGNRYLYYSAKNLPLVNDEGARVHQLLQAFARECLPFTQHLSESLKNDRTLDASLVTFATWLDRRQSAGYHFIVVLDDLPCRLATDIATRASGIVTAGHLMLVSDEHALAVGVLAERLSLDTMTIDEIVAAYPDRNVAEVQQLAEDSGGIPLLVAAEAQGKNPPMRDLLAPLLASLSPEQRELLHVIAVSDLPLPGEVVTELSVDPSLANDLVTPLLVHITSAGALTLPGLVRRELCATITRDSEVNLREKVAEAYENVAYRERTGGFRRARVITLYSEALRQRTLMFALRDVDPEPEQTVAAARDDAFDLDYELLEEGDEPAAAKAIWNMYQSAAAVAGFGEDREVDARYARCLQRLGLIEDADEILGSLTAAKAEDDLQIRILLRRADVLKDRGERGSREERLRLLARASEINHKLRKAGAVRASLLDDHEGDIEQSVGNALGYGEKAQPDEAIRHLARAVDIFERLHDYRAERAYAEKIEIARYNGRLSGSERTEAIDRIRRSTEGLLARSVRRETILRLYELGRLDTDWHRKAEWYRDAYERAGDAYAPLLWHAAIHWKCAEIESGQTVFSDAAPEIITYCGKLEAWQEQSWSRRVLRDAFLFLARYYATGGDTVQQRRFLLSCQDVIARIEARGEERRDCEIRAEVDEEIRRLPPQSAAQSGRHYTAGPGS